MTRDLLTVAKERALKWTKEPFDAKTRAEVQALLDAGDDKSIENRFALSLEFGTAGLRGVMGAGTAMMNAYMIAKASLALALCLKEDYAADDAARRGVVIGYDCRHHSEEYARIAADVIASAGVKVFLLDRLTPTPVVPFLLRRKNAFAGVMVTSSHNPPKYNGYKVFWDTGAQIVSPVDAQIAGRMDRIDESNVPRLPREQLAERMEILDEESIREYMTWATETAVKTGENNVDIVYTPLGGTGWVCAESVFKNAGFTKIHVVEEEKTPSPDFAGLEAPNPEHAFSWPRSLKLGDACNAEIILANDGDADRLGVAIAASKEDFERWSDRGVMQKYYNENKTFRRLTGNQIGALILYYLLLNLPENERNEKTFALCSVVSSPLCRALSHSFGISHTETLTGFKWMGNIAADREKKGEKFLFAYEEAYGFTFGDSRDKDGITAVLLLSELAAHCKAQGKRLSDVLDDIYLRCGIHLEDAYEVVYEGVSGKETMNNIIAKLRTNPPKEVAGSEVVRIRDMKEKKITDIANNTVSDITEFPAQNMLTFNMKDGSWLSVRPSGTEPKIKAYFGVIVPTEKQRYQGDLKACDEKLTQMREFIKEVF